MAVDSQYSKLLAECLQRHDGDDPRLLSTLLREGEVVRVNESEFLWQANSQQTHVYFLLQGLLYAYFETEEGRMFCKEAYWEQELLFAFRSLIMDVPYPFNVKAIESAELVKVPKSTYQAWLDSEDCWRRFHEQAVKTYFMYKEEKEEFLLLNNPEQRVRLFNESYPDLLLRLPQHIIASYLGITPISFSRIKKRLKLTS